MIRVRKREEDIEERWRRYVARRNIEQEEEEKERERRILKSKLKTKSYELLRLCREIMGTEGVHWKASSERRAQERLEREEKHERLAKARRKKGEVIENEKCKKLQRKMTDM